jgi:hypothetical protein
MRHSSIAALFALTLASSGPARTQSRAAIDVPFVEQSVKAAAALVEQEYFNAAVAASVAAALRDAVRQGRYSEVSARDRPSPGARSPREASGASPAYRRQQAP